MKNLIEKMLLPGDVVVAKRLMYNHYGIYIGGGKVVHFASKSGCELNAATACIIETSLSEFSDGSPVFVEESDESGAFPPDLVVERAKRMVGKMKGDYNLVFNNCEHFTHWCKYGNKKSTQVNNAVKAVAGAAVAVLGLIIGGKSFGGNKTGRI